MLINTIGLLPPDKSFQIRQTLQQLFSVTCKYVTQSLPFGCVRCFATDMKKIGYFRRVMKCYR